MRFEPSLLEAVQSEIYRQDAKWGPDRSYRDIAEGIFPEDTDTVRVHVSGITSADRAKSNVNYLIEIDQLTWADILMEEVCEALEEENPIKRATELIQIAAVCLQWANDIASRT